MDQIITNTRLKMQEAFDVLRVDFSSVRTGRANPALIENIVISAYNGSARLKVMELSTIHAQDTQTLVITPFDHSVIVEIEKGIADSPLGIHPVVDGEIIRISFPPLTEERRRELVKLVNQKAEQGKIMLRQARHDGMNEAKKRAEGQGVSEDEVLRVEKEIQKATDEYMEQIDTLSREKEEELMRL